MINLLLPHAGAALQGHAPQHTLHTTLSTLDGSLPQAVVAVSVGARSTVTYLSSSSSSNSSSSPLLTELRLASAPTLHGSTHAAALEPCTSAPPSDLTASEPAGVFPAKMKKCSLVHPSRCPDSFPLAPSPVSPHVCSSNCTMFLLDTEVEFHDDREASSVGDALVVDLLQPDCVQIIQE